MATAVNFPARRYSCWAAPRLWRGVEQSRIAGFMLNYDAVKNWKFEPIVQTYTQRDCMLYALGLNIGADPMDRGQLRFVYEKELQTIPTMATVLGSPGFWWRDPGTGADWVKLVHGEQAIRVLKPLPAAATVVAQNRVMSITDKGGGKGAILVFKRG